METMPRPRPPYLHREVTRHGKPVWYVRVATASARGCGPNTARPSSRPNIRRRWQAARSRRRASAGRHAGLADRALSRDDGVAQSVRGHAASAREHFQAGDADGGRRAVRADHQSDDRGRSDRRAQTPTRRAISSTRCAACSAGRSRPSWSRSIQPLVSKIRRAEDAKASGLD